MTVTQEQIVRTYSGPSRDAALDAYRLDAARAVAAGYAPISHRWTEATNGPTLIVAFGQVESDEFAESGVEPATGDLPVDAAAAAAVAAMATEPAAAEPAARRARGNRARRSRTSRSRTRHVGRASRHPRSRPCRPPDPPDDGPAHRRRTAAHHPQRLSRKCPTCPSSTDAAGSWRTPTTFAARSSTSRAAIATCTARSCCRRINDYADMSVLFMHNEGYSTMCGHGMIAITTALIEEGLFPATEPVTTIRYEVPAGIVAANAATRQPAGRQLGGRRRPLHQRAFVPRRAVAWRRARRRRAEWRGRAVRRAECRPRLRRRLLRHRQRGRARTARRARPGRRRCAVPAPRSPTSCAATTRRTHPTDPDLGFVYGTIIVDLDPRTSPDGTRTRRPHPQRDDLCRRRARSVAVRLRHERDPGPAPRTAAAIKVGQEIINAGITGEHFLGRVEAETALGAIRRRSAPASPARPT